MSEEIKNENINSAENTPAVEEKLDNPLVVHKKGDASFEENSAIIEMNDTHTDDGEPTLDRHRFRKEKKGNAGLIIFLVIVVVLAGVFAALYFTGNIRFTDNKTTKSITTTTEKVTTLEEKYQGTILIKDMYIFVNGKEVNGIEGLQKALKYEDKSTTAFTLVYEHPNTDFLNEEILRTLEDLGFFGEDTPIEQVQSSGLIAEAETTTLPPETTTTTTTKPAENNTEE